MLGKLKDGFLGKSIIYFSISSQLKFENSITLHNSLKVAAAQ